MRVHQFEDKFLAQYSYAVLIDAESKVILIDPARNPEPYYQFAKEHGADIIGVIETHPHADFVSSHVEIQDKTIAKIYGSKLINAAYAITHFDEGNVIEFGKIRFKALNTPGHSPDSISVVLEHDGKDKAVFTGDTLFVGDCGRPDLRESGGEQEALREFLAKQMYASLRKKLAKLDDDVIVYPGHGAGTLCGKALADASSTTIGEEKQHNWSLQEMPEEQFVKELTSDLPFIPAYFSFNVDLNKKGAARFADSIARVPIGKRISNEEDSKKLDNNLWVVDVRDDKEFKKGHLRHSVNIMDGEKFETWLGSIIKPGESYYLAAKDEEQIKRLVGRTASIGYESQIKEAFVLDFAEQQECILHLADLKENPQEYTIVDVRNPSEVKQQKIFPNSLTIPLAELRGRIGEIPTNKPIAVHCAGGYRSAAASSLISSELKEEAKVYDISGAIKNFQNN